MDDITNDSTNSAIDLFQVQNSHARFAGESLGVGSPLVFLHAGVADRRMWQLQMFELSDSFQTIAYDRRGFGETKTDDEKFSHVEDLHIILDRLKLSEVSLVGCSQGGRLAIDFTLAYPKLVKSLVLIAPAISGAPKPESYPPEIEEKIKELDEMDETGDLARVNEIEANLWLDGPASLNGRVGGVVRELFLDMNGIALHMPDLANEIEPESAYGRLDELSLPVSVIWGDLDFPHVKDNCHHLVATVRGARGLEIRGTAHLPNLEQPEVVNNALRSFL